MGITKLYPFECINVERDEKKVIELYEIMREDGKVKGYTPIIIIEDEHGLMEENIKFAIEDYNSFESFTKACLEDYKLVDLKEYFQSKKEYYDEEDRILQNDGDILYEESNSIYLGEKGEKIYIAKVPTNNIYEIMAYIPMGGFNECPENYIHIALAKYWYDKYGAYPICIGNDTIQFRIDNSLSKEVNLEELALEQYLYCGDIVWQGVETLNNLKSSLANSKVWYFWWD
ncbi:MAG: DUF4253 domain-containing protein [Clostridiales bacterium]|nr:DUF4253 domain-containing protein [Clostridiales bacterium]